jgi:hypothetical protein
MGVTIPLYPLEKAPAVKNFIMISGKMGNFGIFGSVKLAKVDFNVPHEKK